MNPRILPITSYCLMICLFFISCNQEVSTKTSSVEEHLYTFKQQGWKSKRVVQFVGDINYSATEVPLQYYLLKNIGEDASKIDSIYKANNRERIIEVEFQHADQTDLLKSEYTEREYDEAVKYMAFSINKDFKIITSSNDTIVCSGANFERNFKVAPFKRVLLHFNGVNPDDTIKLIYQDYLFGNGIIKFNFNDTPLKF